MTTAGGLGVGVEVGRTGTDIDSFRAASDFGIDSTVRIDDVGVAKGVCVAYIASETGESLIPQAAASMDRAHNMSAGRVRPNPLTLFMYSVIVRFLVCGIRGTGRWISRHSRRYPKDHIYQPP